MNGSQTFFRKATLVATFSIITVLVGGLFVSVPMAHATTATINLTSPTSSNIDWSGTHNITWTYTNSGSTGGPISILLSTTTNGSYNQLVSGVDATETSYSWSTTGIPDGTKNKIKVLDQATNVEYASVNYFTIDNTAPTFTITSSNLGTSANPVQTTGNINVTVDASVSGVKTGTLLYGFDSTGSDCANATYNSSNTFASESNFTITGDHTDYLCVEATDNAGNTGYKQVGQLNTDNTAPTISTVTGTTVQLTGATPANDTIAVAFSEAVKPAGNGAWSSSDFTFKSSSGTTVDLSGAAFAYDSSTKTLTVTLDGANAHLVNGNTVTVTPKTSTVEDLAGNFLSTTAVTSAIIKGDTIKPTVALTYTNNGPVKNGDTDTITATFNEVIDGTPKISIAVPGTGDVSSAAMSGSGLVWTYPWTVTKGGTGGTATVSINAQDLAGNQNAVATSNTIAVDNTAPTITSYTLNGNNTDLYFNPKNTSATIVLTASEPVDWTTVRIQNVANSSKYKDFGSTAVQDTAQIIWNGKLSDGTSAPEGAYEITYHIKDLAGNETSTLGGTAIASHKIIIDTTNPTISINSPVANHVVHNTSGGVSFVFSAADTNLDKCAYKIDSGSYNSLSCSSPQTLTLKDGRQTVTLKATDKAGNSKTTSVDFVVDTDGILTVAATGADFTTIQSAINAAKLANSKGQVITTINVAKGQYGKTNIDTPITINGVSASINPNGATPRISESTISASNGAAVTINSNGVTLKGFTITSSGGNGVKINSGFGTENFSYNIFSNITNSDGPVYGISIGGATESEGINISNNAFDHITTTVSTNYMTPQYAIAYGIYTNNSAGADLTITDNTFSNLSGFGTHAIGLEGPTPSTSITGNTFSSLSATAPDSYGNAKYDKFGIFFQNNPDGGSVTVHENKFIGKKGDFGGVAVSPKDDGSAVSYTVSAENNWWGSGTGPYSPVSSQSPYSSPTKYPNPNGLGVYVSPNVDFTPYYVNHTGTGGILSDVPVSDVYVNGAYTDGGTTMSSSQYFGYNAFKTIQNGVDATALSTGGTVHVAKGTYSGNVTISKALTLEGPNATINPNDSSTPHGDEAIISGASAGNVVTVASDGVTIGGFKITNNGEAGTGIYSADHSDLTVENNIITNIGNSGNDKVGRGIEVISSANAVDGVSINDNKIDDITSGLRTGKNSTSASGISIGWSNGSEDITNLSISDNVISNINANTTAWTPKSGGGWESANRGYGAYGILLNHTTPNNGGGKTIGAHIVDNKISDLTGYWAHGIGLEGDTPGAVVTGNTISGLIGHKNGTDAVAVHLEDNPSAGTVRINDNKFSNVSIGVNSVGASVGEVDATNNWWGDASGPFNALANPHGTGSKVYPSIADAVANSLLTSVDFNPFYNSDTFTNTNLVSSAQIASFDLSFGTNPQTVGQNSTLTVMAKDAGGYTVVNTTPQITLIGDNGASFGKNLLTLGNLGATTTTITSPNVGTVNVTATEVGGSAAGTGTITFSATPTVTPTLTLTGDAIASPYTVDQAATRFGSGLQFNSTNASSVTVNGASANIDSSGLITAASLTDAVTLGLHLYTVKVTSSTGNTVAKTVGYQVNANTVTPITPTITLYGDAIASPYTATEAGARFDKGLRFTLTGVASVTINGVNATLVGDASNATTTIAKSDATTIGLHVYNVVVTSSTGNTANVTVAYQVNANPVIGAPVISSIQAMNIGTSTATIWWTTDKSATSQVDYGTTSGYGKAEASSTSAVHKVTLTELTPNTRYHFRVISTTNSKTATSGDNTFTTVVDNSTVKNVVVTNIAASSTMAMADGKFKDGWSWVFDVTVPTNETKLSLKFKDFKTSDGVNVIPAGGNIRFYSPQSSDANSTSTAMTIDTTEAFAGPIDLNTDMHPTIPGRQIQVMVEMKVPTGSADGLSYSSEYAFKSEVPTP